MSCLTAVFNQLNKLMAKMGQKIKFFYLTELKKPSHETSVHEQLQYILFMGFDLLTKNVYTIAHKICSCCKSSISSLSFYEIHKTM
jgi:hypothetical protein